MSYDKIAEMYLKTVPMNECINHHFSIRNLKMKNRFLKLLSHPCKRPQIDSSLNLSGFLRSMPRLLSIEKKTF